MSKNISEVDFIFSIRSDVTQVKLVYDFSPPNYKCYFPLDIKYMMKVFPNMLEILDNQFNLRTITLDSNNLEILGFMFSCSREYKGSKKRNLEILVSDESLKIAAEVKKVSPNLVLFPFAK